MLERWYKECVDNKSLRSFRDKDSEFYIYKGFKLERVLDIIILKDVRYNDFYNKVFKKDKKILKKHGFIKGCDLIMYERDSLRVNRHKGLLESLYIERKKVEKNYKNPRKRKSSEKRLRSIGPAIQENIDFMFFYDARRIQTKEKYKLN